MRQRVIKILDLVVLATQIGVRALDLSLDAAHLLFRALALRHVPTDALNAQHAAARIVKRSLQDLLVAGAARLRLELFDPLKGMVAFDDLPIGLRGSFRRGRGVELGRALPERFLRRNAQQAAQMPVDEGKPPGGVRAPDVHREILDKRVVERA